MKRADDYKSRRAHLEKMSDSELKEYFWKLTEKLVDPLIEMGKNNTTPAIERSVLLRMGFSSLEAKPLVDGAIEHNLIGYGVGNVVYRFAKNQNIGIREAGLKLIKGESWAKAEELFKGEA
ncbi:MAG TPA: ornithine aminomutase subunit alpha [Eubacteriales bacterium]|nr:ornithine aminomutase subunit alpha [Eubacteriales bacterium]